MTEEIKSCPFCGSTPSTWWDINEPGYEEGFNITCLKCHIPTVCSIFEEDAIVNWNRRTK